MTKPNKQAEELALIYDGECPVCTAYSCSVDVDEAKASGMRRINARSNDALVKQAKDAGIDLDEGMIVLHEGKMYHGAEALNIMARLAPDDPFCHRTLPTSRYSTPSSRPISCGVFVVPLYCAELLEPITRMPGIAVSLPRTASVIPSAK